MVSSSSSGFLLAPASEPSNDVAVRALRDRIEAFAQRLALDAHYAANPHARPSLAAMALATARLDGDPLADQPDLVTRSAREVVIARL